MCVHVCVYACMCVCIAKPVAVERQLLLSFLHINLLLCVLIRIASRPLLCLLIISTRGF